MIERVGWGWQIGEERREGGGGDIWGGWGEGGGREGSINRIWKRDRYREKK